MLVQILLISCVSVWAAEVSSAAPLRIDVVAYSQVSHILAVSGLAQRLARRNHTVRLITYSHHCKLPLGVPCVSVGDQLHPDSFYDPDTTLPGLFNISNHLSFRVFDFLHEQYKLQTNVPDVMLFDSLFPAAYPFCKDKKPACVTVVTGVPSLFLRGYNADNVPFLVSGLSSGDLENSVLARIKNALLNRATDVALPLLENFILKPFHQHVESVIPNQAYRKSDVGHRLLLLTSGIPGIAPAIDVPPLARVTGPWLPRETPPLPANAAEFLNQKPFVFVSLGTNAEWHCGEAQAFFAALQKLPFNVLWSIKDAQSQECKIPSGSNNVKTVAFVDQESVLKHKNIRAFVSHCGYASLTEALFYGVPIAAFPGMLESDQPTNALRAVDLNVGRLIDFPRLSVAGGDDQIVQKTILETINFVANDKSIRASATFWKEWCQSVDASEGVKWVELAGRFGTKHLEAPPRFRDIKIILHAVTFFVTLGAFKFFSWIFRLCFCRSAAAKSTSSSKKAKKE